MDMKLQSIRKYQNESITEKHIIAGKAAERKRMVKMKKKAVVFGLPLHLWQQSVQFFTFGVYLQIRKNCKKSLKTTMMTIWTNICMTA